MRVPVLMFADVHGHSWFSLHVIAQVQKEIKRAVPEEVAGRQTLKTYGEYRVIGLYRV